MPFLYENPAETSSTIAYAYYPFNDIEVAKNVKTLCVLPFNATIEQLFMLTPFILGFLAGLCLMYIAFLVFFLFSYNFRISLLAPYLPKRDYPINNFIFKSRGNCLVLLRIQNEVNPMTFEYLFSELAKAKRP